MDSDLREALSQWAYLEARRRIMDYDDPRYEATETAAGNAATRLIVQARLAGIAEGLVAPDDYPRRHCDWYPPCGNDAAKQIGGRWWCDSHANEVTWQAEELGKLGKQ